MEWKIFYYPCVLDKEKYSVNDSTDFDDDTFNEAVFDQTSDMVGRKEKINLFTDLEEAVAICNTLSISKSTMIRAVARFKIAYNEKEGWISRIESTSTRRHFTCYGCPFVQTYCEVYE